MRDDKRDIFKDTKPYRLDETFLVSCIISSHFFFKLAREECLGDLLKLWDRRGINKKIYACIKYP